MDDNFDLFFFRNFWRALYVQNYILSKKIFLTSSFETADNEWNK